MSERFAIELPGSAASLDCETWKSSQDDRRWRSRVLQSAGLTEGRVEDALASAVPIQPTPGALSVSLDEDRKIIRHERAVLGDPEEEYLPEA